MRGSEALHAAALLIDEDRRFATHSGAELPDQASQIARRRDIALEKDEAPGIGFLKELPFRTGQRRTCKASDKS